MTYNENIKMEDLGQEQNFRFWKFAVLHTILAEDEFRWHPVSLTNYFAPPPTFTAALNKLNGKGTTGG
jgi:hypothetical protein